MAINALQVAWISRLADKKVIRPGDSILEFAPQDLASSRNAMEMYGTRHSDPAKVRRVLEETYDGERPRPGCLASAFYSLFGAGRYRSVDLMDPRSDWLHDFNVPFELPERFDIVTNFGTAEHVFNIAAVFHSVHNVLKPGGVALHVLPAFGDIDHGFFNVHPTAYLDLAAANGYVIEDLCYVDRWDVRNLTLEENVIAGFDFDSIPIRRENLRDREKLQRMVTEQFIANYNHPKTRLHGPAFPGVLYDYCIAALRKREDRPFRYPIQSIYGGGIAPLSSLSGAQHVPASSVPKKRPHRSFASSVEAIVTARFRQVMLPVARASLPKISPGIRYRPILKAILRDLTLSVTGADIGQSRAERVWIRDVLPPENFDRRSLDGATLDQAITLTENRLERFYKDLHYAVTVPDLRPRFLEKIRSLLWADSAFVAFVADRYLLISAYVQYEKSPLRQRVINDLLSLIVRPPLDLARETADEIREFFTLVRDHLSKQPYPHNSGVSARWEQILRLGMRTAGHLTDPLHIAILGMARLAFDAGMPILGDTGALPERRATFDRLHPELRYIGESALALPETVLEMSGITFSPNFEQGLGYYHEIIAGLGVEAKMDVVVEIGSGFGKLARILRLSNRVRCLVLVDLPESLALCFAFLKANFPDARAHVIKSSADVRDDITDLFDLIFCPIQQLQNLRLKHIDLLINTYSMGEMQQGSVDFIQDCVRDNLKPKHFFSLNTIFTDKNLHFAESGHVGQGNEIVLEVGPEWWPVHYELITRPEEGRYRNEISVVLKRVEPCPVDELVNRYLQAAKRYDVGSGDWLVHAYFAALWTSSEDVIEDFFEGLRKYHAAVGFTEMENYDFDRIGEVRFFKRRLEKIARSA